MQPLILINAVGLTRRLLAFAPRLKRLAETGWIRSLEEVMPAVTCSAQASILTGKLPQEHGIVGNGWLFRDTREVRFWQQSSALDPGRDDRSGAWPRRGRLAVARCGLPSSSGGSTRVPRPRSP